jgi:hypothetical protein
MFPLSDGGRQGKEAGMSEDDRSGSNDRLRGVAVSPAAVAFDPLTSVNDRVSKIALTILHAKVQGRGSRRLSDILAQCDDAIPPTH